MPIIIFIYKTLNNYIKTKYLLFLYTIDIKYDILIMIPLQYKFIFFVLFFDFFFIDIFFNFNLENFMNTI